MLRLLIISSLIFVCMASLQPSNAHDGNPHISPGKSKADSQEACVEPTDVMRKEHYLFLLHQRDETVVNGIRTKNHSLANCIDCHVTLNFIIEIFTFNSIKIASVINLKKKIFSKLCVH